MQSARTDFEGFFAQKKDRRRNIFVKAILKLVFFTDLYDPGIAISTIILHTHPDIGRKRCAVFTQRQIDQF